MKGGSCALYAHSFRILCFLRVSGCVSGFSEEAQPGQEETGVLGVQLLSLRVELGLVRAPQAAGAACGTPFPGSSKKLCTKAPRIGRCWGEGGLTSPVLACRSLQLSVGGRHYPHQARKYKIDLDQDTKGR